MASEPFDTVEAAIQSIVEAELTNVAFYRYEPDAIGTLPAATLVPSDIVPEARGHDQGFTIGAIRYDLRLYTRMNKDPRLTWDDAKQLVRGIFDALGSDRSLSLAVNAIDIEGASFTPVIAVADGHREMMIEIGLMVHPRYVAS